jgi:class 3 adenylate cyclase
VTVVDQIQQLKKQGVSMEEIVRRLRSGGGSPSPAPGEPSRLGRDASMAALGQGSGEALVLTVDTIPYPAYMVNHNLEVTWLNPAARGLAIGAEGSLPASAEARHLIALLWRGAWCRNPLARRQLMSFHLALAKDRLARQPLLAMAQPLGLDAVRELAEYYDEARAEPARPVREAPLRLCDEAGRPTVFLAYASRYREGLLFVFVPEGEDADGLLAFLARRDDVIRALLRQRLPVLTPLAVLVADLQNSVRICAQLPPDEYFALINEIRAAMEPLFRRHYGTHGKHAGDGMVHYFFPQPDSAYIDNALACAWQVKREMARLNRAWQLRKGWPTELHLNVGLNEGQEWLGTIHTATSVEFTVVGETINHAARLSDLARQGAIWATKNFVTRLSEAQRARTRYGVRRRDGDGREDVVEASYARVADLVDAATPKADKLRDIGGIAVAEILNLEGGVATPPAAP